MRLLLDTNIFLWCIAGERNRLSTRAAEAIEDEANDLLLSVVSLWEVVLKAQAGKLDLPLETEFFQAHMGAMGIESVLPVEARHVFRLLHLPPHHHDPFDRLLIAQCQAERLRLIASDRLFRQYAVDLVW